MCAALSPLGGQAVLDGVVMRNGDHYGLAVRRFDGSVCAQRLPWISLFRPLQKVPFLRGFPLLLETAINGVWALNRSAELTAPDTASRSGFLAMAGGIALAAALAVCLFVAAPHLLAIFMAWLGVSSDVDGAAFHIWDGVFKAVIFLVYVGMISLVPEIRRLFACHGAEHKAVGAWESQEWLYGHARLGWQQCMAASRLHPRCGTAFLLFVALAATAVQAVSVPLLFHFWEPQSFLARHAGALLLKLCLIIPISGVAYEMLLFASSLEDGPLASFFQAPGLALQRLTTREPGPEQLEVALVAMSEALGHEDAGFIDTGRYLHLDPGGMAHYPH